MFIFLLAMTVTQSGNVPISPTLVPSEELGWRSPVHCGPNCLYVMLTMHGKHVRYQKVLEDIKLTAQGANIADLLRVAKNNGLSLVALRAQAMNLNSISLPAIAHFYNPGDQKGHFVVMLARNETEDTFTIIECTLGKVQRLSRGDFLERWSGVMLVCSDDLPDDRHDYAILGLTLCAIVLLWIAFHKMVPAVNDLSSGRTTGA